MPQSAASDEDEASPLSGHQCRAESPDSGAIHKEPLKVEQKILLTCLCTSSLLAGCLTALMIPFFPVEARGRGLSQTMIGAVFSCFAATQLVVYPLTGRLVPRLGVSRSYCLGLAVAGGSTVAFGVLPRFADTRVFIAACFATRMVEAVAVSLFNTAALAIVAQRFPGNTNTAMALAESMVSVGISVGPAVGGGLYHFGGYGLPFYILGTLILLCAGAMQLVVPNIEKAAARRSDFWSMVRLLGSSPEVWLCCLVALVASMNWTSIDQGVGPYVLTAIGITPAQIGLYFLVATGTLSVFSFVWGWLYDHLHNTYLLMTASLTGAVVGLLMLAPSPLLSLPPAWWLFGLGMTVKEISTGGMFIPIFPKLLHVATARGLVDDSVTQAFVSSVFWSSLSLGSVLGPIVGGVLTDAFSFPLMTTVAGGWTLVVASLSAVQAARMHITTN